MLCLDNDVVLILEIEEKKHIGHTKHILLQDQTYYFNYLIARKP